jgi:FAD/FMN-containing dehydrogenase
MDTSALRMLSSWGNVIRSEHDVHTLLSRHDPFPDVSSSSTVLPYGNGRSYGDSCLNVGGALLSARSLDRFIRFDRDTGVLACESGVLLAEILALAVPYGWFPPVVPGTSQITVGGAIANDVHGKNHHRAGTFGCHVHKFELLRSNGERLICSAEENTELFCATVGGLGLTGLISWAELQLRPVPGEWMQRETVRFANVDEFFELSRQSEVAFEYTVAWIDCLGRGKHLGRGLLQRANHAEAGVEHGRISTRQAAAPFMPPVSLVNTASLRAFNTIHYHRQLSKHVSRVDHFRTFFFPLDNVRNWNRLYGPRGFYQYQCVIPAAVESEVTVKLLEAIARSRQGSFLAVLKRFGTGTSPGMLSFPRAGTTLALDFPNTGSRLDKLFHEMDSIVAAADGRLYPAKDGRMPGGLFRRGFPRWQEFSGYIDPAFSSSFWRRVMASG